MKGPSKSCASNTEDYLVPNSAWEPATYEAAFVIGGRIPEAVRRWTKWRRIKWVRQRTREKLRSGFFPAGFQFFI